MNRKIYKSKDEVLVDGVLGGIAEYFEIDPTLVRLAFVFGLIFLSIDFILFYIFAAIIIPRRPTIVNRELKNNYPLNRFYKNMNVDLNKPVEEVKFQETEIKSYSENNIVKENTNEEVEAIYLRNTDTEEVKNTNSDDGADYEKVIKETHVPLDQTPPQVVTATIPKS